MTVLNFYFAMVFLSFIISIVLLQLRITDLLIDIAWPIITVLWLSLYLHKRYWRVEKNEKNE